MLKPNAEMLQMFLNNSHFFLQLQFHLFLAHLFTGNVHPWLLRMLFSCTFTILSHFRINSVEPLTYHLSSFTCSCKYGLIYFRILVSWQSAGLITSLPRFPALWIWENISKWSVFASEPKQFFCQEGAITLV